MAGRHAKKTKSKAPLIIIIIAAVLIVGGAIAAVFFIMNNRSVELPQGTTAEYTAQVTEAASETQTTVQAQTAAPTTSGDDDETQAQTQPETGEEHEYSDIDVAVPVDDEGDTSTFDATFIPNGKVIDTLTGEETTLREVFGEGFSDAVLTFNSDGTYRDTLEKSGDDAGAYVVQNGKIIATSIQDRNKQITVTEWNGNVPVSFYVDYGGCQVYFG